MKRKKFLTVLGASVGGLFISERAYDYFSESTAKAKIVIVGGGAAGISMAARLNDALRYPDITLIEPRDIHHYQPGYTFVASGVFEPDEILKPTKDLIPNNVTWLQDSVVELLPESQALTTAQNGKITYDFLVLASGCQLNYNLIEGISGETLGEGNVHSIYDYKSAQECYKAIQAMANTGGKMVFSNTYTKLKCGGAPKKICMLADAYLRNQNRRDKVTIDFYSNSTNLMTPKVFGDRLAAIYKERCLKTHFKHRLVSVNTSLKQATFEKLPEPTLAPTPPDANYEKVTVPFDFLHIVPPMSAPDFVKQSPLVITEGKLRHGGWVDVDKETLIHKKYKNIISLGDVAGCPTSKTGAAIRIQAPIATANLVALMEGKNIFQKYNGYTACPIVTEYGKVLMCEFGYEKELMPTFSWLDPAIERGMWWHLKKHGLKPMYFHGMLKGMM